MKSDDYSIARWISVLYRYGQSYINKKLEPYNIGSGQYIFLFALYEHDGVSQEELSDHLRIDKTTTAKAIKRLEEEGYVTRSIDSNDKRAYKVFVTQKALDIKTVAQNAHRDWRDILSSGLSEEDKDIVVQLFEKMAENASEYVEVCNNSQQKNCCKDRS